MSISDVSTVMVYIVQYCVPAAFIINFVGYAAKVVIGAATGKGLVL